MSLKNENENGGYVSTNYKSEKTAHYTITKTKQ